VTISGLTVRNAAVTGSGAGVLLSASPETPTADAFPTAVVVDGVVFENVVASQDATVPFTGGGGVAVIVPEAGTAVAFDVTVRNCVFRNAAAVASACLHTLRPAPLRNTAAAAAS
jgi:hypothetical protein